MHNLLCILVRFLAENVPIDHLIVVVRYDCDCVSNPKHPIICYFSIVRFANAVHVPGHSPEKHDFFTGRIKTVASLSMHVKAKVGTGTRMFVILSCRLQRIVVSRFMANKFGDSISRIRFGLL